MKKTHDMKMVKAHHQRGKERRERRKERKNQEKLEGLKSTQTDYKS